MKPKNTHSHQANTIHIISAVTACVFSASILVGSANAASSWAPTLLVNTEAFQIIDDTDSTANIVLKFGGSLAKTLTYDRTGGQFVFDDDLEVIGTISGSSLHAQDGLTSSGTLVFEGAASGSSLYLGNSLNGVGLTDCDTSGSSKLLWDATTGRFSCGTDLNTETTGTGSLQMFFDNRYVRTSGDTMTGALLIHSTNDATVTADTGLLLEVSGTASGTVIHAQRQLTSSGSTTIGIYNTAETGLFIDQNTNARGIDIDTEATTQNALEISASTLTTGKGINIGDGDAFTTGTGLLATFVSNSSNTGKRSLFHLANEHTSADSTLVMNLKQNGDTTNLYLDQNGNGIAIDVDSQATSEAGVRISMPSRDASANPHLLFGYENLFDANLFRNSYNALTTSGSLSIDPYGFNGVYRYDGASYNSNLTEARTTGGTAFSVLANENPSNDYFYVGMNAPFGVVHFDIATAAVGISSLGADYWNGSTWVALGVTDNTTQLTVDGTVEINPPGNWTVVSINADTTSYYWLRIHANSANITTAPTAYSVSPNQGYRMRVWGQADDAQPALFVSHDQKVGIKTSAPKTELEVVGTISGSLITQNGPEQNYMLGNLGIGTTAASGFKFAVQKNSTYNSETTAGIAIHTGTAAQPEIVIGADNSNTLGYIQALSKGTSYAGVPLVFQPNAGNVGIGLLSPKTTLEVQGTISGAAMKISGTSVVGGATLNGRLTVDGISNSRTLALQNSGAADTNTRFIDAIRSGSDSEFIVYNDGSVAYDGAASSPADYAEWLETVDIDLVPGELVSVDLNNPNSIRRATSAADPHLFGIISTRPGILGTRADDVTESSRERETDPRWKKVAFLGQVPTSVIGPISIGDAITSSDQAGVGRKAIAGEPTVCIALESYAGKKPGIINCVLSRSNGSGLDVLHKKIAALEKSIGGSGQAGSVLKPEKGSLTVTANYHIVEGGSWDDGTTIVGINGGVDAQTLVLQGGTEGKTVSVKKSKSLLLNGNFELTNPADVLVLLKVKGDLWTEISRSGNSGDTLQNIFNGWSGSFNLVK